MAFKTQQVSVKQYNVNTDREYFVGHEYPFHVTDYWLEHAVHNIEAQYGHRVSIFDKSKDLVKFGHNNLVGTSLATIQHQPSGILHETYVSDNLINTVISTSTSDTQEIVIEGHTISGGIFTFVTQTIVLTGQTPKALSTALARVTRLFNNGSTQFVGVISVTETDTFTNGVPATATKVHLQINAGEQQSDKCSTTLSGNDYWIITSFSGELLEKGSAYAEIVLQVRLVGKVFRTQYRISGNRLHSFQPYFIVPPNSDIRLAATADGANTEVAGGIQGVLASVVG